MIHWLGSAELPDRVLADCLILLLIGAPLIKTLLMLYLVGDRLDTRNEERLEVVHATLVAHLLTHYFSLSPLQLSQVLEWASLDNPVKGCHPLCCLCTFFPRHFSLPVGFP